MGRGGMKMVRVELGPEGNVIRIFRDKSWLNFQSFGYMSRAEAVLKIRQQVYLRCSREAQGQGCWAECERCGKYITWDTMEMHETVPKGKGGEVSLENCEALCHDCHTGSADSAHGNRRWQTAKLKGPND